MSAHSSPSRNASTSILLVVCHHDCEPWEDNPRRHADTVDDEMTDLIASVSANGVRQSLTVRKHPSEGGKYQIAAGARRWHALGHAIESGARPADDPLPVRVEELDDFAMKAAALEENLQRKPMSVLDEAEAYLELSQVGGYGDNVTTIIAAKVGKSRRHVQNYIAMARDLSDAAKSALGDGRIGVSHARVLTGVAKKEQDRFLDQEVGSKPLKMEQRALRAALGGKRSKSTTASPRKKPQRDGLLEHAMRFRVGIVRDAIKSRPEVALPIAVLVLAEQAKRQAPEASKDLDETLGTGSDADRWAAVSQLRVSQVHTLLARVLAVAVAPRFAKLEGAPPMLEILAAPLKLDTAAAATVDDDLLKRFPKRRLVEMARGLGTSDGESPTALRRRSAPELRAMLLDERSPEATSWLPAELRFSPIASDPPPDAL